MIHELRLDNFKCFQSETVSLAPLTYLLGPNSAGKSSVLQALLLLRQSVGQSSSQALNLHGPLYPIGSYKELVRDKRTTRPIGIGLSIDSQADSDSKTIQQADWWFVHERPDFARLNSFWYTRGLLDAWTTDRSEANFNMIRIHGRLRSGKQGRPKEFTTRAFSTSLVPRPVLTKGLRSQGYKENTLFNQVVTGLYSFERAIRRITALGAFRAAPIRSYQYTGASNFETDLSGELSAQRIFRAISSNSFENRTFLKALAFWMTRLVGYKIDEHAASESFRGMFSIYLKDTYARNSFNFADVGFGVSQAMPILIAGLSSRRGDVLLIQQPELHLHPDAQIAMADFLLFLAQSGRQVIAETHSEHMILRTRVALADSSKDYQSDLVKLQIFSRAKGSQQTKRVEVNFDSIGTASAWPTGFFEQATEQRMILLKHQAKYLQNIKG